jgi:hypothetical protein
MKRLRLYLPRPVRFVYENVSKKERIAADEGATKIVINRNIPNKE